MAAAAAVGDTTLSTVVAASGWVVAAGLAYVNIRNLFDYPVCNEDDSPQQGDPNGAKHLRALSENLLVN